VGSLKQLSHRLVRRIGFDIVRYRPLRAELLCECDLIVDVGANAGQFGGKIRDIGWRGLIISFEPLPGPYSDLSEIAAADGNWMTYQLAIGDMAGETEMTVASNDGMSSSLLRMMPTFGRASGGVSAVGTQTVRVCRLDDVPLPAGRCYLKLDVQGYELSALRGASSTLDRVAVVEAEVSLARSYEGQPLLPDVADFLRTRGFALRELEPNFRDVTSGDLIELNGFFVKS
jgi:FkbM family methyltransferase